MRRTRKLVFMCFLPVFVRSRLLTARQREIMLLAAQGLSNKEIARRLTITEGTVKLHLHKLYDRLGIRNRTSLAVLAHNIEGHDAAVNCGIGIAITPDDRMETTRPLRSTHSGSYNGKTDIREPARLFTSEMDADLQARLALKNLVRDAASNDAFDLYYQPVFQPAGDRLIGFEALLRLRGFDAGLVSPAVFIPLTEQMGMIGRVGAWVLRSACCNAQMWPEHLKVAVNLSPAQFETGDICEVVAAALKESGLEPSRLELEITESLLLRETETVMDKLWELKALGVAIVMDDFGTGYSSLTCLWRFPFDKIKIDRSFMDRVDTDHNHVKTIVRTVTGLGRSLHMQVTLEGVETARQVALMRDVHCDHVQGFFFGRPMTSANVMSVIQGVLSAGGTHG